MVAPVPLISEVLLKHAEYGDGGLLPAAEELVRHGHIVEYLHNVTRWHVSPDEPIVGYRHPNGFTKVKLARLAGSDWSVRLHLWDPGAEDSDIHDHRWGFASYVMSGSIAERRYEIAPGVGQSLMYNCSASLDGSYLLTGARMCDPRLVAEDIYEAGSSYQRDPATMHRAMANGGRPAVTLFVQGAEVKNSTTVVRQRDASTNSPLTSRCSASELLDELRNFLDLIADA